MVARARLAGALVAGVLVAGALVAGALVAGVRISLRLAPRRRRWLLLPGVCCSFLMKNAGDWPCWARKSA